MKPKLVCECGEEFQVMDKISIKTGVQWDEWVCGYYILYACRCGFKHWEHEKKL